MQALLVVGGTDPTGGAGIHQDVLQAHDAGVWACPVVTATTVQTPERFDAAHPTDAHTFIANMEAAAQTVDLAGVKVGYLANEEQVEYLAAFVRSLRAERPGLPIVVDLVGVPTAADDRPERRAVLTAIADKLLPVATTVTPDLAELEVLADHPADDLVALEIAAKRVNLFGATGVHVKGAENSTTHVTDRYITKYTNDAIHIPRSDIAEIHGSGCALATRIAAHLMRGLDGLEASRTAAHELSLLRLTARYGKNPRQALLSPRPLMADPEAPEAVRRLEPAVPQILRHLPAEWVAECGNNIGYAPTGARTEREVAVLRQRIRLRDARPDAPPTCWRAPRSHIARVALAAAVVSGTGAAALNLRHTPGVFAAAAAAGLTLGTFDRSDAPDEARSSVEWGTRSVLERGPVDLVSDDGGPGKEPMVRLLAADPDELVRKLERLVAGYTISMASSGSYRLGAPAG